MGLLCHGAHVHALVRTRVISAVQGAVAGSSNVTCTCKALRLKAILEHSSLRHVSAASEVGRSIAGLQAKKSVDSVSVADGLVFLMTVQAEIRAMSRVELDRRRNASAGVDCAGQSHCRHNHSVRLPPVQSRGSRATTNDVQACGCLDRLTSAAPRVVTATVVQLLSIVACKCELCVPLQPRAPNLTRQLQLGQLRRLVDLICK